MRHDSRASDEALAVVNFECIYYPAIAYHGQNVVFSIIFLIRQRV